MRLPRNSPGEFCAHGVGGVGNRQKIILKFFFAEHALKGVFHFTVHIAALGFLEIVEVGENNVADCLLWATDAAEVFDVLEIVRRLRSHL